ncbi:unnamed protein product [Notodromas monacha]|uniref:Protein KTI12 homolog n=1 Tax=Notodromas monacha TaxID=399045 RepID=A0A7R9BNY4_9CRUS|nr:unnamed protein product [Notodromas monacha]CAG0918678.1 unnamed protein product [Notodromas monacha]
MPLVVFTGLPSLGKADAVDRLTKFFEEVVCVSVDVVRESDFVLDKMRKGMRVYLDSKAERELRGKVKAEVLRLISRDRLIILDGLNYVKAERELRGKVKAEVLRLISRDRLIILDGLNYVKGFRYELFCASKAARTNQCTIYLHNSEDDYDVPGYDEDVLRMLRQRYEVPDAKNRWDSPLFHISQEEGADNELILEDVRKCLYDQAPPTPNKSTECSPLSDTDLLQKMDELTRNIVSDATALMKVNGGSGVEMTVADVEEKIRLPAAATVPVLSRLRRQFLTFMKSQPHPDSEAKIKSLFVQYLNSNFPSD